MHRRRTVIDSDTVTFGRERRSQPRHDVSLGGELIWAGGAKRTTCKIVDMSVDGARVDTRAFVDVPERLHLLENGSGTLFECEVRWHRGAQMGLFFIDVSSRATRRALIQKHAR